MRSVPKPSPSVWVAVLTLATAVIALVYFANRIDTATLRADITRQYTRGNFETAEQLCLQLLVVEPEADDVRLIAAECAVRRDRPEEALDRLRLIKSSEREIQLSAVLMTAQLLHRSLFRLSEAETAYRDALRLSPVNIDALTELAQLLAVCGRRREALPLIFELVRQGEASDLLFVAARSSGAINDQSLLQKAREAAPNDACALLGLALHANEAGETELAIQHCRDAFQGSPELTSAQVALGQYLLEARRFDELADWNDGLREEALSFPETWLVRGQLFEHQGDTPQAIEAYQTAVRLGPDVKTAHYRLSVLCRQAGDDSAADYFSERLSQLRELESLQERMFDVGHKDPSAMLEAIQGFQKCGRIWEALGWSILAINQHGQNPEVRLSHEQLLQQARNLPLTLYTADAIPTKTVSTTIRRNPEKPAESPGLQTAQLSTLEGISFRDDASSSGLQFRFFNGVVGPTTHRMFEFTGGGIGVVDIDLDDYPDVFFAQGGIWHSEDSVMEADDSVFRNLRGHHFEQVSDHAQVADHLFGQGVAVGDINNDGFPDVLVANIGANRLWVNCGDGTFSAQDFDDATISATPGNGLKSLMKWSTSAAIADLNQDGTADAYIVNYLAGSDVFTRVCPSGTGDVQACIPTQFEAVADRLYLNQDGRFSDASHALAHIPAGKGLGVLVFSSVNDGRPSIYVANDTTPNMLLNLDRISDGQVDDIGMQNGVALNAVGRAEGSMGIAATDLNADGLMELFVTNFYNESNTLYQQAPEGFFDDRTADWDLRDGSLHLLGFGTQFLDANGDGIQELFVANGHVDDLRKSGKPYHMPAQLLTVQNERFRELPAAKSGEYFQETHLGRAVAVLDWNRDQRPDLMVGHLDEEYAVLTNTSHSAGGRASLRLVGVTTARDAVPASVRYYVSNRLVVHQLSAGDGYLCSNQKELLLTGIPREGLASMEIRWPSGAVQSISRIEQGRRYVVVEHRDQLHSLPD